MLRRVTLIVLVLLLATFAAACYPDAPPPDLHAHPFLVCTRMYESDRSDVNGNGLHDGGYAAVSPGGTYRGAYQFLRSTWDSVARHAGWHMLVGVDPAGAQVPHQDMMAWHLYQWQGSAPWGGRCG